MNHKSGEPMILLRGAHDISKLVKQGASRPRTTFTKHTHTHAHAVSFNTPAAEHTERVDTHITSKRLTC